MNELPVPGGKEEQYLEHDEDNQLTAVRRAKIAYQFVTSRHRASKAIRNEIVESAINFIDERTNMMVQFRA